ncbi:MAG TPA: prepilin peptidase [Candidatus Avamphibacillus sp.]|nr:prepilin peptidase [Candidatus Avamphibacillus sp.]
MEIYWIVLFFIFGSILGSFFNVVGLRVPKNIPFSNDRSYCPTCKNQLQWYELIPIASYLFQHGQCRNCQTRISPIYPVIELSTGLLFALAYWKTGFTFELVVALMLISLLMIIFVTDITYMLIPNKILLFFLPLFAFMRIISPLDPWYDALIGAGLGFVLLASIIILSKGGMGGGDMKLFAVLGIVLGWKGTLLTLFLASFLGAIFGLFLITINKVNRKQLIPFGPYIVIAALISYFYGDQVISMYLSLF